MNVKLKNQVTEIVTSLSSLPTNKLKDEKGNLDVNKFNKHPRVIQAKEELKELGINKSSVLSKNGFIVAAMLLRFNK